jgi:DNA replication ATP-dependent helicase Dna2
MEELLCSIKYGIKEAVDAWVSMASTATPSEVSSFVALELKSDQAPTHSIQYTGQVLLYTLLLSERYYVDLTTGLLMYLHSQESIQVQPVRGHLRALVQFCNVHASHLFHHTSQRLPPLIKKSWDCQHCFYSAECMLHHAVMEDGNAPSISVPELFEKQVSHLSSYELAYFRRWIKLLDWETTRGGERQGTPKEKPPPPPPRRCL